MSFSYNDILKSKEFETNQYGFDPVWECKKLFDFQKFLVEWAVRSGRSAIFADCGLGKTPTQLTWAENIHRKTNKPVLILTPLAVSLQTIQEGAKFGIEVKRTQNGKVYSGLNVTNYERLKKYDPKDFAGVVCDESSVLKNFDGVTRRIVTDFLKPMRYRLLCTATPAPNDFMELGTSSEALGQMTRNQMLGMFFANDGESTQQWRLKGHAKKRFWQWMASWSRAIRRPSDLGFDDSKFILPPLNVLHHILPSKAAKGAFIADMAVGLDEQREEQKRTLIPRCEKVAELAPSKSPYLVWCHSNAEGDLLTKLIPGAVQVAGSNSDEEKEERLIAFGKGQIKCLVTKPKIACFGLNWQNCNHIAYFPSHSHESYYQAIRRCWRFGQEHEVNVNLVYSESGSLVVNNMIRKEKQSIDLYDGVIRNMYNGLNEKKKNLYTNEVRFPKWLQK